MKRAFVGFAVLAAAAMAGCTGGHSFNPPGSTTHVTIVVSPGPQETMTAVAYRIGRQGTWRNVATSGSPAFTLPGGETAYSVAYNCSGSYQYVLNLTTANATSVTATCVLGGGIYGGTLNYVSGTYDATAASPSEVDLWSSTWGDDVVTHTASGSYFGLYAEAYPQTFLLVARDASGNDIALKTMRNVNIAPGSNTVNYPALTTSDLVTQTEPITLTGASGMESATFEYYAPTQATAGILATFTLQRQDGTTGTYSVVPAADWQTGDLYYINGVTYTALATSDWSYYSQELTSLSTAQATTLALAPLYQQPANADLSYPLGYNGFSNTFSYRGGFLAEWYTNASENYVEQEDYSSPEWLSGQSSYAPETFAGATGFTPIVAADVWDMDYEYIAGTYDPGVEGVLFLESIPANNSFAFVDASYYNASNAGTGSRSGAQSLLHSFHLLHRP